MPTVGNIIIDGSIGNFDGEKSVELVDVIAQVNMQKDADSYNVYINSPGGYVDVGFAIYDYLVSLKKPITSIGENMVASIATVIFMAGSKRIMRPNTEFMIHLPSGGVEGNSEQIAEYSAYIQEEEKRIIKFYKDNTDLNEEAIRPMLSDETWLNPRKAFELGFSTIEPIELKAVAKYNLKPENKMSKEQKQKLSQEDSTMFDKFFNRFEKLLGTKVKNIIVQDANGEELDFVDLEEGQEISVGDMATKDGAPAEGEYVLPNGETYVFTAGELTEIIPAEEGEGEGEETVEDLLQQIEQLTASNVELEAKLKTEETKSKEAEAKFKTVSTEFKSFKTKLESKFDFTAKKDKKKEDVQQVEGTKALKNNFFEKRKERRLKNRNKNK